MSNNKINLSSGLEDYIEAIYVAQINQVPLKGAELARKLNISRASVSEALSKLVSKGLISYKSYGVIALTKTGETEAEKVYSKHNKLKIFFEKVLGISAHEASENACKIEHIISENLIKSIENFTKLYLEHEEELKKIITNYK